MNYSVSGGNVGSRTHTIMSPEAAAALEAAENATVAAYGGETETKQLGLFPVLVHIVGGSIGVVNEELNSPEDPPATNLRSITENTVGPSVQVSAYPNINLFIIATGVTTGATISLEVSPDNENWATVDSVEVTEAGASTYNKDYSGKKWMYVRTVVSEYTDGSYTTILNAGR